MLPLMRKNKLRIAIVGAVVGLGAAVAIPNSVAKDYAQEVNARAMVAQQLSYDDISPGLINVSPVNLENNKVTFSLNNSGEKDTSSSKLEDNKKPQNQENQKKDVNSSNVVNPEDNSDKVDPSKVVSNDADDQTEELSGDKCVDDYTTVMSVDDSLDTPEKEEVPVVDEEPAPKFYDIGVRHSTVMEIQQRLMDLGFMEDAEPTDYYGSITAEAVKMFQRQSDLKQDGILGPDTFEMLLSDNAKHYAAKLGMDGADIKRIQQRLYEMGYLATADMVTGHFGDVTESAVKKMQENNGLGVDGKVGKMTVDLLYSEEAKPNLIAYGEQSDIVLAAQKRLKELGYLTTTPDGKYGNDTSVAVKQFQSRNDLVVDGFLGPSTREVLKSSSAVPNGVMLGDSGDAVKRIQELLNKYGYLSSANMTGYFGEVTEDAVKSFQKNNGLSADGNVGVMTMTKLTSSDVVKASSTSGGSSNSGSSNSNSGSSNSSNSGNSSNSSNSSNTSSNNSSSNNNSNSGAVSGSVSELIRVAKSKVGTPYILGAKGPNAFDCSGFIYWCLNQVGVKQSYLTSSGWRSVGKYKMITSLSNVQAGDIIVVRGHVGIAAGNGTVIDASSSSGRIVYRDLNSWWSSRFIVAWRIFD
ncbi:peptidoglycan-binding protein [Lachnoclostridium phytofermentans]|uniref:Peptidoglycan-binding domain 1 protein n=1 Tax=Lachnoclostridium phytofermentans (strain ATCC 700394 / DSM 18823 / ISDg) TaxID=357809 RepID=A9KT44_LACP7|nr:peptidoglycan-binding protein [Lachnoclostridium phytofermentans]ABX42255.1 Peptidoglycan-binding domain 1 protein [Lachnoclostridium phytofermentans ISDg]